MQSLMLNPKTICAIIAVGSLTLASQAQVIDPLTGSLSGYTTTLVLDNSLGAGSGVLFSSSASGLQSSFVGTVSQPEQALFLAPVSSFGTAFAVGERLSVNVSMPVSSTQMDFGLAVSSTATPIAAGSGNGYNSRTTFDWASVSVRPSQAAVRGGADVSGTLNTSYNTGAAANTVTALYIDWVSADVFNLGYIDTSAVGHNLYTATFNGGSTIGAAIGFYGDLRAASTSLGNFTDLTISPVPEPSTLALCGAGFAGLFVAMRRKK